MTNLIYTGMEYGVDFKDVDGNFIEERIFDSEEARDEFMALPDDEFFAQFPENAAAETAQPWQRKKYRLPIYGLDYGRGSVKARFGGGYVPRGAYQFHHR